MTRTTSSARRLGRPPPAGQPQTAFYVYGGNGQRVRKATDRQAPAGPPATRKTERIYLGAIEIYREYAADGTTITLERETLHVGEGDESIALVETRIAGTDKAPGQLVRYQYSNHLGSAVLELDDQSNIISYEEYFPYGSTSYQAVASQTDLPKRYRYTGKERDEENDLYYHGARYYAPWLAKWTACDPAGLIDGTNVYAYVTGNPIRLRDSSGRQNVPPKAGTPGSQPSVDELLESIDAENERRGFATLDQVKEAEIHQIATTPSPPPDFIADAKGTLSMQAFPPKRVTAVAPATDTPITPLEVVLAPLLGLGKGIQAVQEELGLSDLDMQSITEGLPIEGLGLELGAEARAAARAAAIEGGSTVPVLANDIRASLTSGVANVPKRWAPGPGKEVSVGTWLERNLSTHVDAAAERLAADPARAATDVPSGVPYVAVPQYGGYVVEYGAAKTIQKDWILDAALAHNPLQAQLRLGGAPDFEVRAAFKGWGVKPFDVTTPGQVVRKAAAGKDYTFVTYDINWNAVRAKLHGTK